MSSKIIKALAIVLLVVIILGEWLWWESYKCTVNWSKRSEPFPLPFYIIYLPHWLVVDLAILLITLCATAQTIIIVLMKERASYT